MIRSSAQGFQFAPGFALNAGRGFSQTFCFALILILYIHNFFAFREAREARAA